ncbi:unnamed protein product [Linum trigynum]|uniref:Uncharacterized protein n=1 Tax=Linum trigynum TaxID=586398 RepID=A0AAV2EH91_9ROSI
MAAITNYLLANLVVVLVLATKGLCVCDLNGVTIGTTRSGSTREGEVQWNVEVINNCACPISNLVVSCKGFASTLPVNPALFKQNGDKCLVNGGNPIAPKASVKFSYAWHSPTILIPNSLSSSC